MPPVPLPDEQLESLAIYLGGLVSPPRNAELLSKPVIPTVTSGRRMFMTFGCIGCHDVGNEENDASHVGWSPPDDWTKAEHILFLKQPHAVNPDGTRLDLNLTDNELEVLATFLLSLGRE